MVSSPFSRATMEDIRREFGPEPEPILQRHNVMPPKRPAKVPIEGNQGTVPPEKTRKQYDDGFSGSSERKVSLPSHDAADAAIAGSDRFEKVQQEMAANYWTSLPKRPQVLPTSHKPNNPSSTSPNLQCRYQDLPPPRPAQSQDDIDVARRPSRWNTDEGEDFRLQMETLRRELREANGRAAQAERVVEQLQRQARINDAVRGNENSASTVEALAAQIKSLKSELDDAHSHIFSLQPFRKDFTPKEIGQDYDDLVYGVAEWVGKLAEPIVDDPEKVNAVLALAKKRPTDIAKLRRYMDHHVELINGCMFPETDIDILIAIVMRFLQDNVFQSSLFGCLSTAVGTLDFVEQSMQKNVEPKRDTYALRTWRAEAMNAVICSPEYMEVRRVRIHDMTEELASVFKVLCKERDWNKICKSCVALIVKPAVELHEKFLISTHHYYLELEPMMGANSRHELAPTPEFYTSLPQVKCENILQNRKPFDLAKIEPKPTKEQLYKNLTNVTTIVPGLSLRMIGKGDALLEPKQVRMQQMLVAWGNQEKRDRFTANTERTLMNRLYYLSRDKPDRVSEGIWSQFRHLQWG
ncbi:hypothetical protein B0T22DRAFT_246192 [Podospora appendiculata]|uniref:Uncharacterized protein n=1 Tax=Podospora appendiculata TaxID=314037 RepID=A0AAE0X282_9PEZI|nr:hypothetical protein B0T22DRAFT_246192 [Podospora appendiculata]